MRPSPLQRLREVPEGPEGLAVLDLALREAVAHRLGRPLARIDRRAFAELPPGLAERAVEIGRALDRARFAGDAPSPDLTARVESLVATLEARAA